MGVLDALGLAGAEKVVRDVVEPSSEDRASWTERKILEEVLGRLDQLPSAMRQALADHLWADIPRTIVEYGYNPNAVSVAARAETAGLRRITAIYSVVPSGSTGYVQFGNTMVIPVPTGSYFLGPLPGIILDTGDTRQLFSGIPGTSTPGNSGLIALVLFGEQLPRWGQLD